MSLEMFIYFIVLFKKTIFFLRLFGWKQLVPLALALNKTNYARYRSYYVNSLENMDSTHPGCSEITAVKGLSVQGQDKYPCRTAVDQRGEQTINRDAKTSGGVKYFASDPRSILKWTLNRSTQARNTQAHKPKMFTKLFVLHIFLNLNRWLKS